MTPREALEALVYKLDAVHEDARYQSVWQVYAIHGFKYTEPTYIRELEQAKQVLDATKGDVA